jgi:pantoate--beta-alanine ligase
MPIIREADGLAMSSRNAYLSAAERKSALCLSRALAATDASFRKGEQSVVVLRDKVMHNLQAEHGMTVEYVDFRHKETLEPVEQAAADTLVALAVRLGKTRLIDNMIIGEGFPCRERC